MIGGWKLALRSLGRHRRRNLATGLAVALGYAGLLLLTGYLMRVESYLRTVAIYAQHTGHLAVYKKDGLDLHAIEALDTTFSAAEAAQLESLLGSEPGLRRAVPYLLGTGLVGNGCKTVPFLARGVDPEHARWIRAEEAVSRVTPELARPTKGQALAELDPSLSPIALSVGLARVLGKSRVLADGPSEPVWVDCESEDAATQIAADTNVQLAGTTDEGSFSALDGEVAAWFSTGRSETEDNSVLLPLELLQELYDTGRITYFALFLDDPKDLPSRAANLQARLADQGFDVDVYPFSDGAVSPYYTGAAGFLKVMALFIAIVVFAVVALSILNTMTLGILERGREIATLRSIGFTRPQTLGLFLREALLLTGLSMAAGLLAALGVAFWVAAQNIRTTPPGVPGSMQLLLTPTPGLLLGLAAVLAGLSLVAAYLATRRGVRRSIPDLMTGHSG